MEDGTKRPLFREPTVSRILYVFVLLILAYYVVRLPLFLGGYYRNEIIPSYKIFTNNPVGILVGAIWVWKERKMNLAMKLVFSSAFLALPIWLTFSYLQSQPGVQAPVVVVSAYFFIGTALLMPWFVILGCDFERVIGPKIFKHW